MAAGSLLRVLQRYSPRYPGLYLYYPRHRLMPAKLRAFVDHAQEYFGGTDKRKKTR